MPTPLARAAGLVKDFGSVRALDGAALEVAGGQVHAVLGENGAGKTSLLHVLGGLLRSDAGMVEVGGVPVTLPTARSASAHGIELVHQHFALAPRLTVLENLTLGWPSPPWTLASRAVAARARTLMVDTGLTVPLDARVDVLGVGERQRVEVLRALLRGPRILLLDEPTAVLTPGEVDTLFGLLRRLADGGTGVVLVGHKLDEVLSVADRVTVMRHGRTVLDARREEVDASTLSRAMVGEEFADAGRAPGRPAGGAVVARLEGVSMTGPRGEPALRDVTLEVRRGEVVAVAGVEGNGQRHLARVLAGRERPPSGTVLTPPNVGFVPQDRSTEGLVADFDLTENVGLALVRSGEFRTGPFVRWAAVERRTEALLEAYAVRAPGSSTRAGDLSGGNQQRLVVARELEAGADLFVMENPTRGLDVAAAAFVHDRIRALAADQNPPGIVVISTDLDEVLALGERVVVMVRGRLEEVPPGDRHRAGVAARMLAALPEEE